ncbi:helix-turn-helix transcriptional regulator [Dactylosporangium vinaceum]|uniref:Winged helix-turn-helix transcriptional regulator n=1 Tax=Dactylosporangium vinaceum TaxID=53362 RepID=A0ABV5M9U0_9ACTN|nr:helix-turn-helix domain-containing protein [Dactylosporangium vinaceum]UAC00097.1 helix-turn-helix transcriptional regulator [Dactylosporangium vinaceum]
MRTYGQFCGIARALDVVGDRWVLLIVRELIAAPARFTDLRRNLPGIATNLLAERLRTMTEHGLVTVVAPQPPVGTHVYELTERGRALGPTLRALARWSLPLMLTGPGDDLVRGHWTLLAMEAFLEHADLTPADGATIEVTVDEDGTTLSGRIDAGRLTDPRLGPAPDATVRIAGTELAIVALFNGADPDDVRVSGSRAEDFRAAVRRRPG